MPIYSEVFSDTEILGLLNRQYKKVAIVGCGACTNESLAYKNSLPIFVNKHGNIIYPYATVSELLRIKSVLCREKYQVEIQYYNDVEGFVCMKKTSAIDTYAISWDNQPDIILTLCCGAGYETIREMFPKIPVVKITNQIGFLFYSYIDNKTARLICRERSAVITRSET